jgi:hypothetical protein
VVYWFELRYGVGSRKVGGGASGGGYAPVLWNLYCGLVRII